MNTVEEVLVAMREDTESTHWCQSHYEDMVEWVGTPEEALAALPRRVRKHWNRTEFEETFYKVRHCLVGMVNSIIGVPNETSSDSSVRNLHIYLVERLQDENTDLSFRDAEDQAEPKEQLWLATIDRLGLTVFGEGWDSDRRLPSSEWVEEQHRLAADRGESYVPEGLEGWNDAPGRDRDGILAMLDQAIEAERTALV